MGPKAHSHLCLQQAWGPGGDMGLVFSGQCFWAERGASS